MQKILVLTVLNLWSFLLKAQDPYAISFTEINGLSSNHVYDIYQDRKGFIWFATDRGLSRYDGFQFVNFHNDKQLSKSGSYISEDAFGRIWYMNFDGYLLCVQNGKLHGLDQNEPIGCLNYGIDGSDLFVIEKSGVAVYDLRTLRKRKTISFNFLNGNYITSVMTKEGFLCVGSTSFLIDKAYKKQTFNYHSGKLAQGPGLNYRSGDGRVFFCSKFSTENCLYVVHNNQFKPKFKFTTTSTVQALSKTSDAFWACTINGVFGYSIDGKPLNDGEAYFKDKSVSAVFEDKEKNLWVSTTNNGVLFVPNRGVRYFPVANGPSFFFKNRNEIVSTNSKGQLRIFSGNRWVETSGLRNYTERIERLFVDPKTGMIATSSKSFDFWDHEGNKVRSWGMAVKDLQRLDDRYFLVAISGFLGVFDYKPSLKSKWTKYVDQLPERSDLVNMHTLMKGVRVKSICVDQEREAFYFSTNLGVFHFSKGNFHPILFKGKQVYLNQILRFKKRIIGLDDNGKLFELVNGAIRELQTRRDFPSLKPIDKIKVVGATLYLIGNRNVYMIDNDFSTYKKLELNIESSDFSDIIENKDYIFIATNSGILTFAKQEINHSRKHSNLEILSVKVNNRIFPNNELTNLSYEQNDIEIAYAILNFSNPNRYPLHYRMNGMPWKMASPHSRILSFAALEPGNYTIEFMMNGVIQKTVRFSIDAPWWKSVWFYLVAILCILGIMFVFFRSRIQRIQKRNELLTEKLLLEKSLKETMLKSVKAQMNPHFFYNALNTVQSFIFEDDKRNASTYLSKFSVLSRMILEMSEMELVTLEMECKAIRLYMDIEEARFSEDFVFHFEIDSELSQETVRIPPMLIQPYLENAVKHGLLHKKGKKELHLRIELIEDKRLKVMIRDNGIGRFKSAEINQHKHSQHTSFASNANAKRLQLLQRENDSQGVLFTDLADESGQSLGTIVEIYIPFD